MGDLGSWVQQELALPGVLERFLGDEAKRESVKDIFTGLYALDKVSTFMVLQKLSFP